MTSYAQEARDLLSKEGDSGDAYQAKPLTRQPSAQEFQTASRGEGAPFLTRLWASFKADDTGVENYLKSQYGNENVFRDNESNLYFYPPGQEKTPSSQRKLVRFNPDRWDIGDIASIAPIATQVVPGAAAAWFTGGASIPVQLGILAAGGVAGEGANQVVGASLPGKEAITPTERAGRLAVSGAFEAAAPGVGSLVGRGARAASALASKATRSAFENLFAKSPDVLSAARALESSTGEAYTAGQRTGSRALLSTESVLRQLPTTSGIAQGADAARLDATQRIAQGAISRLGQGGGEYAGEQAVKAHGAFLTSLAETRSSNAARNFGAVDSISGDKRILGLNKTLARIDELSRKYQADIGSTDADAVLEFLSRQRDRLLKKFSPKEKTQTLFDAKGKPIDIGRSEASQPLVSATSFQNSLSDFGKKAHDPRGLIERVKDPSVNKYVATQLFDAIKSDLDDAAVKSGLPGEVADALKKARDTYRKDSEIIEAAADQPISRFMENSHKFVDNLISNNISLKDAKGVMNYLSSISPESADEVRSAVFQQLLTKATPAGSAVDDFIFSPAKVVTFFNKNADKINAIIGSDKVAKKSLDDFVASSRLLANKGLREGSQTAPFEAIKNIAYTVLGAAGTTSLYFADKRDLGDLTVSAGIPLAAVLSGRFLTRALMTRQGSQSLSQIMKAAAHPEILKGSKALKSTKQAFIDLASLYARNEIKNEVSE